MAKKELKAMDLVQVTGRITYKRYTDQDQTLFVVLSVSTPRTAIGSKGPNDEWNRDYPAFTVTGEVAEELDEQFKVGDHISVCGHMDTRQRMVYEGNRMYRGTWEQYIVADIVLPYQGGIDTNSVIISGKISRVYRNTEAAKKFYIITVEVPLEDGSIARAAFTHFYSRLQLEPSVGDEIRAIGFIQTRRERVNNSRGRSRTRYIMSVVSRNIVIQRNTPKKDFKTKAAEVTEAQEEETDDIRI